jgi:hypothetical protein
MKKIHDSKDSNYNLHNYSFMDSSSFLIGIENSPENIKNNHFHMVYILIYPNENFHLKKKNGSDAKGGK